MQRIVKDLDLYTAAGVRLAERQPLVAGTTYYAELGGADCPWSYFWVKWDAAVIATITFESTGIGKPTEDGGSDSFYGGIETYAAASAGWVQEPIPTAGTPSITIPGGAAGVDRANYAGGAHLRIRAKIVVGGTGGKLRLRAHHKE